MLLYVIVEGSFKQLIILFILGDLFSHSELFAQVGHGQEEGHCYGVTCKTVGGNKKTGGQNIYEILSNYLNTGN